MYKSVVIMSSSTDPSTNNTATDKNSEAPQEQQQQPLPTIVMNVLPNSVASAAVYNVPVLQVQQPAAANCPQGMVVAGQPVLTQGVTVAAPAAAADATKYVAVMQPGQEHPVLYQQPYVQPPLSKSSSVPDPLAACQSHVVQQPAQMTPQQNLELLQQAFKSACGGNNQGADAVPTKVVSQVKKEDPPVSIGNNKRLFLDNKVSPLEQPTSGSFSFNSQSLKEEEDAIWKAFKDIAGDDDDEDQEDFVPSLPVSSGVSSAGGDDFTIPASDASSSDQHKQPQPVPSSCQMDEVQSSSSSSSPADPLPQTVVSQEPVPVTEATAPQLQQQQAITAAPVPAPYPVSVPPPQRQPTVSANPVSFLPQEQTQASLYHQLQTFPQALQGGTTCQVSQPQASTTSIPAAGAIPTVPSLPTPTVALSYAKPTVPMVPQTAPAPATTMASPVCTSMATTPSVVSMPSPSVASSVGQQSVASPVCSVMPATQQSMMHSPSVGAVGHAVASSPVVMSTTAQPPVPSPSLSSVGPPTTAAMASPVCSMPTPPAMTTSPKVTTSSPKAAPARAACGTTTAKHKKQGATRTIKVFGGGPQITETSAKAKQQNQDAHEESPANYVMLLLQERGYQVDKVRGVESGYNMKPSPLQLASFGTQVVQSVHKSKVDHLKDLLECGLSPNPCNTFGDSILDIVCKRSNYPILKCLVDHGSNLQVCDGFGRTPLHHAAWAGTFSEPVADLILRMDPSQVLVQDKHGKTPMQYVRKEVWGAWIDFLRRNKDTYWPLGGCFPAPPVQGQRQDGVDTISPDLAKALAAGRISLEDVKALDWETRRNYKEEDAPKAAGLFSF